MCERNFINFSEIILMLRILFSILLLFTFNVSMTQNQMLVDSLIQNMPKERNVARIDYLVELAIEYMEVDHQRSKNYIEEILDIAIEKNIPAKRAQGYNLLAVYHMVISDYQKSIPIFEKAIEAFNEIGDNRHISLCYNNMANAHRNMGNLTESLEYHMASLKIKKEENLGPLDVAPSYWNIGVVHSGDSKF